ncbi:MAG: VOC family protein [Rhodospirillaceae bacterium]|jgi:catechol 2,3-dioxygenase-like lactoylglutathione lyase family enzyme|nr:VOC family protein [Rhodospirillaceae bacterium]MBT5456372.1 VOC family protein [Rhodospirillaceae bacterium]
MWTIGRIDHVVVWVRDLEKSMDFYEKLGFEINQHSLEEHRDGKIPFVAVRAGPFNQIDLRPNPDWVPVEREKGNMQHVNVVVDGITDIQVLIDGLAERGVTPDYGPEVQGGSWRIDVYDPDNNRIEMALGIPA